MVEVSVIFILICVSVAGIVGFLLGIILTRLVFDKDYSLPKDKPVQTIEEKLEYQAHLGVVHRDWEKKHDPFRGS